MPSWLRSLAGRSRQVVASRWRAARPAVLVVVALLVVFRSAVFVFWPEAHLDSNQAVFGLMAKHLAEGRAFPLFMYGQPYMLAVEAWLAAPLFLLAGVSVAALKLPLLALNVGLALLLVHLLVRDVRLPPAAAGLAALFFIVPAPGTASKLVEASGGTFEPLLYVTLLWATRTRPALCGLVLGIGFLNREFTLYGLLALLILALAHRPSFSRDWTRHTLTLLRAAAEVWLVVQVLRPYGSAMGPGTSPADLHTRGSSAMELANRLCLDIRALPHGFLDIAWVHWPLLFGATVEPLRFFGIESARSQGFGGSGWLMAALMLFAAARVAERLVRERRWRSEYDFCAYLVVVGLLSVAGYVVGRCGVISPSRMRYDLLSILGAVGLAAWYLRVEGARRLRTAWGLLVVLFVGVGAASHAGLWREYLHHAPHGGKSLIARHLEARAIKYAIADYATAYPVSFLSRERVVATAWNRVRILEYETDVAAHRAEAVRIEHKPCPGGREVMPDVFFCGP